MDSADLETESKWVDTKKHVYTVNEAEKEAKFSKPLNKVFIVLAPSMFLSLLQHFAIS